MVEGAPSLIVTEGKVSMPFIQKTFATNVFSDPQSHSAEIAGLKQASKDFIARLPASERTYGPLINVVADKNVTYKNLYDAVKVVRESGFETLMFVTSEK